MLNVWLLEDVSESESLDIVLNCCKLFKPASIQANLICIDDSVCPSAKFNAFKDAIAIRLNECGISLVQVERIAVTKRPDLDILELLKQNEIDLLLLNKTPFSKHSSHFGFVKSPMQKLLERIPCSVLLLNKPLVENATLKVVFSYTGSIYSGSAGAVLTRFLKPENIEIYIISVESVDYSSVSASLENNLALAGESMVDYTDYTELGRGIALEMEHLISQAKSFLELSGYAVKETKYVQGEPSKKIIEYAQNIQADLIVLGVHRGIIHHQKIAGPVGMDILKNSESSIAILH
jgi:nucleotide-binding universal stress UspA family protein